MNYEPHLTVRENKLTEIQQEGRRAYRNYSLCPYMPGTTEYQAWQQGWRLEYEANTW